MAKVNGIVTSKEFDEACILINARREYPGDRSLPKFFIATDLSEEQLRAKFSEDLRNIREYMIVPRYYADVRKDYEANESKHAKRMVKSERNLFSYGDYTQRVEEAQSFSMETEYKCRDVLELICEEETKVEEHRKLTAALDMIAPLVRERLIENACSGTSHAQIAEKYGVNQSSITRCFAVAFDQIKEMWEEL